MGADKKVQKDRFDDRLCLASCNIGSLTSKLVKTGELMNRRKVNIMCLQETKQIGEKVREVGPWGYKLGYMGKDKCKNGVGILVEKNLRGKVVEVRKTG